MTAQSLRSGLFRLSSSFTLALLLFGSSQEVFAQHVDPAANGGLRALTFARHVDTTFAGPTGMPHASDVLQRCDRISAPDQDIACDITFQQAGGIGTFSATGDGLDIITTQAEINAVLGDNTAWVKVVTMIGFCGGPGTNIIGCAPSGTTMVIDNGLSTNTTGEVVAHEFGHNQGLGHRSTPGTQNLMRPNIGGDEVNLAECAMFHVGLASTGPNSPTDFPPNISCPSSTSAQCSAFGGTPDGDSQLAAFFAGVSAEDGCEPTPTISDDAPSLFPVGSQTPVMFTATDGGGNTDSCSASVTVFDTQDPMIQCAADVTIECDESTDPSNTGEAMGTDVCDPNLDISSQDAVAPGACAAESVITRTWTATDDFANSESCDQAISVVDTTPPVIDCNAPLTIVPPDAPVSFTGTAVDNCDDDPLVEVTAFDCFKFTNKGKQIDKTRSCVVTFDGETVTILDSGGVGTTITWGLSATDECGRVEEVECSVDVINSGQGA